MATYEQTAAYYANQREAQLRALLRRDHDKYRITRDGEVHAYGRIPNSTATGWWFVGYREDVEADYCL